ncbi:Quinone oxidoreductase 1 [BD1-7 clade bacterium]|uniref:Quinone oxidoreductase 1 n=1 Tax=BD1-7 clade bacterium TaxID=2029982 RepID=A0A5S9MZ92_9GAMM|nr:Quinone oxidoreductase 1 [BD1-7 clade bacterium]
MRAAVFYHYGDENCVTVTTLKKPKPSANDVLVKVMATTVTSGDWRMRRADPWAVRLFAGLFKPRQPVLGTEFSGVVEAVGADVTGLHVGDRIFGSKGMKMGAHAQYVSLTADGCLVELPDNLTYEQGAGVIFGGATALTFLRPYLESRPAQRLLVIGGSGAVGTYAVQLGRMWGAHVTAVCSARNHDLVRSLGAEQVVDYEKQPLPDPGNPFDIVIDTVGKSSFSKCRELLADSGVYLSVSGGLREWGQMLLSHCPLSSGPRVVCRIVDENANDAKWLADYLERGDLTPVVGQTLALEEIQKAHVIAESGHKVGNLVVNLWET